MATSANGPKSPTSLSEAAVGRLAQKLWDAWQDHKVLAKSDIPKSLTTVEDGYAVQDGLTRVSGLHSIGWKVGATNKAAQDLLALPGPLSGRIFAPFRYDSPAVIGAKTSILRALEPEIALRMGRSLPPRDQPYTLDEVSGAIAWAQPALEIPDSRWAAWQSVGAPAFIADNASAGFLVLGPDVEDWREYDLAALPARLIINGQTVETGKGGNVMDGPLSVVVWLANHLTARNLSLHAGDLITTGTCTPIGFAKPGDEVIADFGAFGQATARFE